MSGRRRNLFIAVGAILVTVVTLVLIVWPREPEPSYQGKRLSEWIMLYNPGPQTNQAMAAVRQMRVEAIPVLLRWMDYDQPRWRKNLANNAGGLGNMWFGGGETLRRYVSGGPQELAELSPVGFEILGPAAKEAVPELGRLLATRDSASAWRAARSLAHIGSAGLPPLLTALGNTNCHWRALIALELGKDWPHDNWKADDAAAVVTALAGCLEDENLAVAHFAADSLGELGREPTLAVPALTAALGNTNTFIREHAAASLKRFGQAATPAVPALLRATADPDWGVRHAATNALQEIAPEVLTNGVAK